MSPGQRLAAMGAGPRLAAAALLPGALLAVWLGLGVVLLRASLDAPARAAVDAALAPLAASHGALVFGWWLVAAGLGAWAVVRLDRTRLAPVRQAADAARLLAADPDAPALPAATGGLAAAVNAIAAERLALRDDMARMVEAASRKAAEDRDQLAALMAELEQGVVVCNLDGRILLYNDRARALFRRLSSAPDIAGGSELIGLGRSIHAAIERAVIAHARDAVERRVARGEARPVARFVTQAGKGTLLQASLAPVRPDDGAATGFVLMLTDITAEQAAEERRDQHLLALTERSRAALGSVQAALDMLDYPDLAAADRARFHAVVREEVAAMGSRLAELAGAAERDRGGRWPLQDILGTDLIEAAARRIEVATGRAPGRGPVDAGIWLRADSFGLSEALAGFARRLAAVGAGVELRLAPAGAWAHLDLAWSDGSGEVTAAGWQDAPMSGPGTPTPREVAERHGGGLWLARDAAGDPLFRFMLPVAAAGGDEAATGDRPVYYDFDLLSGTEGHRGLDACPLDRLACTVFDCETTGLDPAGGDEIIQLGAVRILNGRLLDGEAFDQLVDPDRSIPEASIPFHGIRPEMLRGAPRIGEVLPALHAFAADTVLVGHNVAFDMRFLALKEAATGVRFDQPVLDTLLLASVAQPDAESHALEAIAARLGVPVVARHSAAGDARTTAAVFLKLLPLLRERGIVTLGEARAASAGSPFARLRY
ncbi:MAG: exonuclease domain-containing protein [Amaricoccus sp.]|uniref:exonuclease domain-containing protein n=1 Tax=Amaricoccus sp. TaxID=1872485 RepID=UPI0039E5FD75